MLNDDGYVTLDDDGQHDNVMIIYGYSIGKKVPAQSCSGLIGTSSRVLWHGNACFLALNLPLRLI